MAYTTARTWTDGELVTAAIMNSHVRDNFNAMGPHLIVRKPSDESVVSSTVLQNDDHLLLALGASEIWQVSFNLLMVGNTTGNFKAAFTVPAAAALMIGSQGHPDTSGVAQYREFTTSGTSNSFQADVVVHAMVFTGVVACAGTPGNLQLQWAQATSNGTNTTVKTHSTLWAVKLA